MKLRHTVTCIITFVCLAGTSSAFAAASDEDVTAVVQAFNAAVSTRDLDGMLATFADGAVKFSLRPAHTGLEKEPGISTDLRTHWSTIAPVLFSTMKSYRRSAAIVDIHTDGDVASVWTQITTESTGLRSGQVRRGGFSELYVIVRTPDGWKIGAMADNRRPDGMTTRVTRVPE